MELKRFTLRLISIFKTALYSILFLLSPLSTERYVPILAYHSVDNNKSFFAVAPDEFQRQMAYLNSNYTVVSLEEVFEFLTGRQDLPKNPVALTFDDGYRDNYVNVYPCARKYGYPIAIFVISGLVGKEMSLGGVQLRILDWEELREMRKQNVMICAHTRTHPDLRAVSTTEATNEIQTSKIELEKAFGQPVDYFAYPKGRYNQTIADLVKSSGFKAAFGEEGLIRRGDNPFVL
ncbi:MAG: polysaccharide deacetylase family protein, partial [Candidatus Bathyarchaeia archaeon]